MFLSFSLLCRQTARTRHLKKKFKTKQTKSASGSGSGLAVSLPTVSIFCSTRSTRGCFLCSRGKENKHRAPWPPSLYSLPHPTCCGRHFVSTCLHRPLFCISPPDRLPTNQPKANHNATHQIVDFVNRLWLPFVYQPTTPPPLQPAAPVSRTECTRFRLPSLSLLRFFRPADRFLFVLFRRIVQSDRSHLCMCLSLHRRRRRRRRILLQICSRSPPLCFVSFRPSFAVRPL